MNDPNGCHYFYLQLSCHFSRNKDGHTVVDLDFNTQSDADEFNADQLQDTLQQTLQKLFGPDNLGGYELAPIDANVLSINQPRLGN